MLKKDVIPAQMEPEPERNIGQEFSRVCAGGLYITVCMSNKIKICKLND
jgi:hypothetical protein